MFLTQCEITGTGSIIFRSDFLSVELSYSHDMKTEFFAGLIWKNMLYRTSLKLVVCNFRCYMSIRYNSFVTNNKVDRDFICIPLL